MGVVDSRTVSLRRADELKSRIDDYLNIRDSIDRGMSEKIQKQYVITSYSIHYTKLYDIFVFC